ncbi:hypothetical protein GGR58DRAFT_519073 [Xylaria digitata]|nr:hypothetical protein GGR58DRAFT_519073 [Xylaria digitata]
MGNNPATSCLSAEPHDNAIKDPLVHYFGCIRFCDRGEFLHSDHRIWANEKAHQEKLEAARNTPIKEIKAKAEGNANSIRERWRNSFNKELRRVELLRKTLQRDDSDKHLVQEVNDCRESWRASPKYKERFANIQRPSAESDAVAESPDSDGDDYVPEKDVSVGIIRFKEGQPFNENCDKERLIWGKFPDQKTSVHSLLREGKSDDHKKNILHKDRMSTSRGELHADEGGPLHAREVPGNTGLLPNNLVLFMPYLYWETLSKREYFALEVDKIMAADSRRKEKDEEDKRLERIRQRGLDTRNDTKPQPNPTGWAAAYNRAKTSLRTLRTMTLTKNKVLGICTQDDTSSMKRSIHQVAFVVMKKPPFKIQAPLAKYLMAVSKLHEGVANYRDKMLLRNRHYGANKNDASGIHKSIRSRVEESGSVHTVFELGLIIIDECSKTFFDRTKTLDRRPQAIDEFSRAIGNIMHKQTVAFKRLWWWTEQAKSVYCSTGYTNTSNFQMSLLDINPEGHLEREIEDIVEELDIMLHISNTHNDILRKFVEQAERILDPKGEFKGSHGSRQQRKATNDSSLSNAEKEERRQREKAYRYFKQRVEEGQARAMDYIAELKKLRESTKKTADDVLHLLSMKQQQASVFQAWQAMKQSDETIKQGRSIMTFTLVTIVFLPLSFLSSVFGMSNKEFEDNSWSISQQILYIFSISAGVVFLSLLFAFSHRTRAFIWSICARFSTSIAARSGLYDFYLQRPTECIYEEAETSIQRVKTDRRKNPERG